MGKVINLPIPKRNEADGQILQMQAFVRLNLFDLASQRKELDRVQRELRRVKAKLALRLIENGTGGKTQ